MEQIEILKKSIKRKHPCDPSHAALEMLKEDIIDLVMLWNDLPDEIRLHKKANDLSRIIKRIGGA